MATDKFSREVDGFIRYTLMRGCDDWVQACEIVDNVFNLADIFKKDVSDDILNKISTAEKEGGVKEFRLAKNLNILIIKKVLTDGLMLIGDVYNDFVPWKMNIEGSINYVNKIWDNFNGKLPGLGIYWLCNTSKGYQIGEQALLEWQRNK
jgi:hypothetical protein